MKEVLNTARQLEDDLCRGFRDGIKQQPCPGRDGTRLAFYITSLTKPNTARDAASQLKVALPLNLFLAMRARDWTSFYVRHPDQTVSYTRLAAERPAKIINIMGCQARSRASSLFYISLLSSWQHSSSTSLPHLC